MFKSKVLLSVALLALPVMGTAFLTGCASTPKQESAGQFIDSSAITAKVKADLLADNQVKSLAISVDTFKDVVTLSGTVDSAAHKARAVDIARHVEGVREVRDELVIKKRHHRRHH